MQQLFQFHAPAFVTYGRGCRGQAGKTLQKWGAKGPVLFVCGPNVQKRGLDTEVVASIQDAGLTLLRYSGVASDAPIAKVREGARLAREHGVGAVVGMGGGSAMDTAKAIAMLLDNDGDLLDYCKAGPESFPRRRTRPLLEIPTTCGTGSEMTDGGVVLDEETHHKYAFWDALAGPDATLLDPELLDGMPEGLMTTTAMDALSHCVEGFTSKGANPLADPLALEGIASIYRQLPLARQGSADARDSLLLASSMAGMAFNRSGVHVGHALAHALGAIAGMHHGTACAIAMPFVIRTQMAAIPQRMQALARAMGLPEAPEAEAGEVVAASLEAFNKAMGIEPLAAYGVREAQLEAIVAYAAEERIGLRAPCPIDPAVLKAYLLANLAA